MAKSFQILREKMSPERRARAKQRAEELLAELALEELRQALNLTQEQVAEMRRLDQTAIAGLGHISDAYLDTLHKFIAALGGQLKLVASFPDREVVINRFD